MQRELAEADPNYGQPKKGPFDADAREAQQELLRQVIKEYEYIVDYIRCHSSGSDHDKTLSGASIPEADGAEVTAHLPPGRWDHGRPSDLSTHKGPEPVPAGHGARGSFQIIKPDPIFCMSRRM